MERPVLLAVDDDPDVLRAVERDLRRKFAERLRIVGAGSGEAALQVLEQLRERGDACALMLVDQRMPRMNGVEFLGRAIGLSPSSKKVMLTAYADTEAAIAAINTAHIDFYLLKPWDPPEEKLYPVLQDLLDDWFANYEPPFRGIKIYGHRWSPETHALKDFLARNLVPYQWVDVEVQKDDPDVQAVMRNAEDKLPLVTLPDGPCLEMPTPAQLGERLGLQTQAKQRFYDLAIVGGGPAGLAAAVYGASEGLSTVILEREAPGGQAGMSSLIENYLGFPAGLSGALLAQRAVVQAKRFGVEILSPQEATGLYAKDSFRVLKLADGQEIASHAVILAMGVSYRRLDVPGEENLYGKGVYYGAAMSEAISCAEEEVIIVGGANSAGQAAMYFAGYANRIRMLVRGPSLAATMSQYLIDKIESTPNIEVCTNTQVVELMGEDHLERVCVEVKGKGREELPADGLFIFIGAEPHTDWLEGVVARDERGFILSGPEMLEVAEAQPAWPLSRPPLIFETSLPGVFAAGDVRAGSVKRVASSVGQGSIAVQLVHEYLREVRV